MSEGVLRIEQLKWVLFGTFACYKAMSYSFVVLEESSELDVDVSLDRDMEFDIQVGELC